MFKAIFVSLLLSGCARVGTPPVHLDTDLEGDTDADDTDEDPEDTGRPDTSTPGDTGTPEDTGTDTGEPAPTSWLGLCDAWDAFTLSAGLASLEPLDDQVQKSVDLGLTMVRPHRPAGHVFAMSVIHPGPETWDYTLADHLVEVSGDAGAELLVTLQVEALVQNHDRTVPSDVPADLLPEWRSYVEHVVERYDGDGIADMPGLIVPVHNWEIGNEPFCNDNAPECMEAFLETVRAAYEEAHAADPSATVMAGGALPVFQPLDGNVVSSQLEFWSWFFDHGGAQYTDVFSFHMATGTATQPVTAYLREWEEVVPPGLPRWLSESSPYGVQDEVSHEDPTEAAEWYARQLEDARQAGVERAMFCLARHPLVDHPELEEVLRELAR